MPEKPIRCELVTWGQVQRLSRRVAGLIRHSGFKPDVVVAIARGGFVPARLLCDYLDLYDLVSIRVAHYESGATSLRKARLALPLSADVGGLNVLLVDDVSDTGDTLVLAVEHINSFAPARIKVATLHHKQVSPFVPDFFGRRIVAWRWLIYPWAVQEDLSGFLAGVMPRADSVEEVVRVLKERCGLDVSLEAAEDLMALSKARMAHSEP